MSDAVVKLVGQLAPGSKARLVEATASSWLSAPAVAEATVDDAGVVVFEGVELGGRYRVVGETSHGVQASIAVRGKALAPGDVPAAPKRRAAARRRPATKKSARKPAASKRSSSRKPPAAK